MSTNSMATKEIQSAKDVGLAALIAFEYSNMCFHLLSGELKRQG